MSTISLSSLFSISPTTTATLWGTSSRVSCRTFSRMISETIKEAG